MNAPGPGWHQILDARDDRIADLLAANNREVELRRQANHERDLSQTMVRAITRALMKAEEDRDSARVMLGEALAELAELRGRNA